MAGQVHTEVNYIIDASWTAMTILDSSQMNFWRT
jgi:hypothetical protein